MVKKESKILVDTDVLINFFDRNRTENLVAQLAFEDFTSRNVLPYISIIIVIEMLQGSKNKSEKNRVLKQMDSLGIVYISDEICFLTKELIISYSSSHGLLMGDAFIDATDLTLNVPLFTFNTTDFKFLQQPNYTILKR